MYKFAKKLGYKVLRTVQGISPSEREFKEVWPSINAITGWMVSPQQERWLFQEARKLPDAAIIVEIGSFKGRSTCCLAYGCRGTKKHVYAIDTFNGNEAPGECHERNFLETFQANINGCGLGDYVTPVKGWSSEVAKTWKKPIHLIFIDGSHQYNDVLRDFESFWPHVVPGGVVAFHDVAETWHIPLLSDEGWPGPLKVWVEVASKALRDVGKCSTLAYGRKP